MQRIDVLGPDDGRLSAASGRILELQEDEELQAIVREAAAALSAPISLVSLVLQRSWFFRAHYGLPEELKAARATDRNVSFCQFVVRDRAAFEVTDAALDERVPKLVVERYGIRTYLGLPVEVAGSVLGSLCVLDVEPRAFNDVQRERLAGLAKRASRRLSELAAMTTPRAAALVERALKPLFLELRNILQPLNGSVVLARVAATELAALEGGSRTPAAPPTEPFQEIPNALEDLETSLATLEACCERLTAGVLALEKVLIEESGTTSVRETVEVGSVAANHLLKVAGGVQWAPVPDQLHVRVPRHLAVTVVSAAMSEMAERTRSLERARGVRGRVTEHGEWVEIEISAETLSRAEAAECTSRISALLGPATAVRLRAEEHGLTLILPKS